MTNDSFKEKMSQDKELALLKSKLTHYERLTGELARKEKYLRVINAFAIKLLQQETVDEIVWAVAKSAVANLGFEDCVVYLLGEQEDNLIQRAAHGPKNPIAFDILNPIVIPMGEGIVGSVAVSGEAEIVSDTRTDSRYIQDDDQRLSELAVPIIHQGRVIGVIDSEDYRLGFYTEEHKEILTTIASMASARIAGALARERLTRTIEKLKRAERLQATLYAIADLAFSSEDLGAFSASVHQLLSHLMYAENFYVALVDEDDMVTFPFRVDHTYRSPSGPIPLEKMKDGPITRVLRTGEPYWKSGTRNL